MKLAGVVSASMFTRDAAGWMRWPSSSKSSLGFCPSARRITTISPSTTDRGGSWSFACATTSGKYLVSVLPPRLASSTSSPSRNTMQRNPSHLGSYDMPAATGISATLLASIGSTGGEMGSVTLAILGAVHRSGFRDLGLRSVLQHRQESKIALNGVAELEGEEPIGVGGGVREDVVEAEEGVPLVQAGRGDEVVQQPLL